MTLHRATLAVLTTSLVLSAVSSAPAQESTTPSTSAVTPMSEGLNLRRDVGVDARLGEPLPLDLEFRNHDGKTVRLRDLFRGKPVILTPVYYRCPMLCGLELQGLVRCLKAMKFTAGEEFDIVTFSIDHREGTELAHDKRAALLKQYGRPDVDDGWQCLVGDESNVQSLCKAIGFRAQYNAESGQYAHAAAIMVCTPEGVVSRYFYGVEFPPRDVRLALIEASQNRIGTLTDQIMLYCYMYDPTKGRYSVAILNVMRGAGVLTLAAMGLSIGRMIWRDRRRRVEREVAHA
ncbi:MAG: SCO family protein [Planctomycetaceae bacterium]|nr:SCO family protein [Planctomycetaceae bacterium]